jgi:UDP-N-acetylmuramoyl-L-alanyl-D-glutamate--2,6-diaminopimelate ligase
MKNLIRKIPGFNKIVIPYHMLRSFMAATDNDYPASSMKVIAVTGTNGKTTTCFMIHKMLTEAGKKVGLMTTVANGVGDDLKPQIHHMTTVSAGLLNKRIAKMRDAGAEYLVLEVTSHALAQHRTFGIPIDVAVMTNVTHEHLDYHKTFENYVNAKRRLFKLANKTRGGKKIGVINAEDPSADKFISDIKTPITYGENSGDLQARQVKLTPSGVEYYVKHDGGKKIGVINAEDPSADKFISDIKTPITYGENSGDLQARQVKLTPSGVEYYVKHDGRKLHIKTQIPGEFNVYNSLAAVAVGLSYGLTDEQIEKGIAALQSVEGRMNRIDEGQPFEVVVDFAHTPDSFEKLLKDFRKSTTGKLIVMFGSAGRRDESKRAIQGEIAGKYADIVVITEEDDRDIDGQEIMKQIADGAEKSGKRLDKDFFKVHDRAAAIEFTLAQAKGSGDVVMLLGKGHEKTIEQLATYEKETARTYLTSLLPILLGKSWHAYQKDGNCFRLLRRWNN